MSVEKELENGLYGTRAAEIFIGLKECDKDKIVFALNLQEKSQSNSLEFFYVLRDIFKNTAYYFYDDLEQIQIYICAKDTKYNRDVVELVEILFLDITAKKPKYFFNKHFGIVGAKETMKIDNLVIY